MRALQQLRTIPVILAAFLWIGFSPASSQAANMFVSPSGWFRIGPEALSDWQITEQPGVDDTLQIKPKRLLSSHGLKHILVLYPRASSAYDTAITKIVGVFNEKRVDADFTVVRFNVDPVRGKAALDNAEANNFDLVMAMGSESTAWLWGAYRGGRLPVVSVCSKDPVLLGQTKDYTSGSGTNFAFTSLNMPIDAQMSYVMQLRPDLKNLAILVDANNLSAVQTQALPAAKFARARGIQVFDLAMKSEANAKAELGQLVRDAVTSMRKSDPGLTKSIFWITGSTTVFAELATINAHAYRVPVLSTVIDVVQPGDTTAVLSVGISFESNAYQAALFAIDILSGKKLASALPVGIVSPPDVAISFRKAREIGLRVPFPLFEGATMVYDNDGKLVRAKGITSVSAPMAESVQGTAPPASAPAYQPTFE